MSRVTLLFLNAGRRVELVRAFREVCGRMGITGCLIGTDVNRLAPALYEVDEAHLLPHSTAPEFVETLARLCRERRVTLVIPLIDPDLVPLAAAQGRLEALGTRVLISPLDAVGCCRDKARFAAWLAREGLPAPRVLALDEARESRMPLFVKSSTGSAGAHAVKVTNQQELEFFTRYIPQALIQEFIEGEEVTVDVFSGWDGRPALAVPRRRLKVRAGEVAAGCVERDPQIEELAREVAARLHTIGPVNVQLFRTARGLFVLELNPRFGGGAPLSIAAGAPFPEWTIRMALGQPLDPTQVTLQDRLGMLRFDQSRFLSADSLLVS